MSSASKKDLELLMSWLRPALALNKDDPWLGEFRSFRQTLVARQETFADADPDGAQRMSLLLAGISGRSTAVVRAALEVGANPACRDSHGNPALSLVLIWKTSGSAHQALSAEVFCLLLAQPGVDPNLPDRYGRPPIYWAAQHDQPEIAAALLKAGADASDPGIVQKLADNCAVNGHFPLMRALCERGFLAQLRQASSYEHHRDGNAYSPKALITFLAAHRARQAASSVLLAAQP